VADLPSLSCGGRDAAPIDPDCGVTRGKTLRRCACGANPRNWSRRGRETRGRAASCGGTKIAALFRTRRPRLSSTTSSEHDAIFEGKHIVSLDLVNAIKWPVRMFAEGRRNAALAREELSGLSLERLLQLHYTISDQLHSRINKLVPNIKLRRHAPFSFSDFVLEHIDTTSPVHVLDIGAGDCFLDWTLSEDMHPGSRFDCYDVERRSPLYVNAQMTFYQQDVLSHLYVISRRRYDYAIESGFLGLFADEQKDTVMDALRGCEAIFVRENPRLSDLIDMYCGDRLTEYNEYPHTFTEQSLRDLLTRHGFEILAFQHEVDIYAVARPKRTLR
jgi:hypothetical protein